MGSSKWPEACGGKVVLSRGTLTVAAIDHFFWTGSLHCRLQVLYIHHSFVFSACLGALVFSNSAKTSSLPQAFETCGCSSYALTN